MTETTHIKQIPLEPVTSSAVSAIGHDPENQIAAVKYANGAIHYYYGVSAEKFASIRDAESIGRSLGTLKKEHKAEKMTGTCNACGDAHGWLGETCSDCGCDVYA